MFQAPREPLFELNLGTIHARSVGDISAILEQAQRRVIQAERALEESKRQRDAAQRALEDRTKERDATQRALEESEAERKKLVVEKRALENETDLLLKRISELTRKLADATDTDRQLALDLEIQRLQRRLDNRNRDLFGKSSERRGVKKKVEEQGEKKKARRRGTKPQPRLPKREQLHLLEPTKLEGGCEKCGGDLEEWEGKFEESERITARRVVYERIVDKQQKYHCKDCRHIMTAPKPKSFMPGGRYTEEFAVEVAVDKYNDSLPLHRQAQRMARRGLDVTRGTLWEQVQRLYVLLVPTLVSLHEKILQAPLVYADETTWRYMRAGKTKKWWIWVISDGEAVYFQLVPSRGNPAGRQLFKDYDGTVMADDYSVYNSLEKEKTKQGGKVQVIDKKANITVLPTPDYVLATCWTHARRYLHRASKYHDEAEEALTLIGKLYRVEHEAKEEARKRVEQQRKAGATDADAHYQEYLEAARTRLRAEKSRPIIDELDAWRKAQRPFPGTAMQEALLHIDKIWHKLLLFLSSPIVPLDNNLSERLIRGPVIGRKNFQGSRSEPGTRVAALFYSLISSCKLMGLDPHDYLMEATRRAVKDRNSVFLPHDFRELLRKNKEQDLRDPAPIPDPASNS